MRLKPVFCIALAMALTLTSHVFAQASYLRESAQKVIIPASQQLLLTGKPGEFFILPDDETFLDFDSQTLPEIIFGDQKILNNPERINQFPLSGDISFKSKDMIYALRLRQCDKEAIFTDTTETRLKGCQVEITQSVALPENYWFAPQGNTINLGKGPGGAPAPFVSYEILKNPFLKAIIQSVGIWHYNFKEPPETVFTRGNKLSIQLISAHQSKTVFFSAEEVWNKKSRNVQISDLDITIAVKEYLCRELQIETQNGTTSACENIVLEFTVNKSTTASENGFPQTLIEYNPKFQDLNDD